MLHSAVAHLPFPAGLLVMFGARTLAAGCSKKNGGIQGFTASPDKAQAALN